MDIPLITIIIPTYNRKELLKKALLSVYNQTRDISFEYELIIIDDGSIDGTEDFIKEYIENPEYRITYRYQENWGVGKARNHGLSIMSPESDYLIFLDSDDELKKDLIYNCLRKWEECQSSWTIHHILGFYFLCQDENENIIGGKKILKWKNERVLTYKDYLEWAINIEMWLMTKSSIFLHDPILRFEEDITTEWVMWAKMWKYMDKNNLEIHILDIVGRIYKTEHTGETRITKQIDSKKFKKNALGNERILDIIWEDLLASHNNLYYWELLFRIWLNLILCEEKEKWLLFLKRALEYNSCMRNRVIYYLSLINKKIILFLYRLYV